MWKNNYHLFFNKTASIFDVSVIFSRTSLIKSSLCLRGLESRKTLPDLDLMEFTGHVCTKKQEKLKIRNLKQFDFFFKLLTISRNDVLFMYMNVNKTCLFFVHDTKKASFNMFFANDGFFLSKVNNNRNSKRILAGPSWPKVLPNKTRAV